jgi:hypothetical protein
MKQSDLGKSLDPSPQCDMWTPHVTFIGRFSQCGAVTLYFKFLRFGTVLASRWYLTEKWKEKIFVLWIRINAFV